MKEIDEYIFKPPEGATRPLAGFANPIKAALEHFSLAGCLCLLGLLYRWILRWPLVYESRGCGAAARPSP
jgi:hypothetical protein